jgi:hypothetical protein
MFQDADSRYAERSIFRPTAVRRYTKDRQRSVIPRFISPPTVVCLWLLVGLLTAGGLLTWFARVPIYASGWATVVSLENKDPGGNGFITAMFLPPEYLSDLRIEQTVFLTWAGESERLKGLVVATSPEIVSPAVVQRHLGLHTNTATMIDSPAAWGMARFESMPAAFPASSYPGQVYAADVEIGSQRIVSRLPLIGPLLTEVFHEQF